MSIIGLFLLQSCDPARILVVKTANKPNYSVTIYANENIFPQSYPYHQDSVAKKQLYMFRQLTQFLKEKSCFFMDLAVGVTIP